MAKSRNIHLVLSLLVRFWARSRAWRKASIVDSGRSLAALAGDGAGGVGRSGSATVDSRGAEERGCGRDLRLNCGQKDSRAGRSPGGNVTGWLVAGRFNQLKTRPVRRSKISSKNRNAARLKSHDARGT